jgi:predicted Rdx family selenoprotein
MTKIQKLDKQGDVTRIVTSCKGSWNWQNAYRIATYKEHTTRNGRRIFRSLGTGGKFARTLKTAHLWGRYKEGSAHNAEILNQGVDDFGNTFYVVTK